MVSSDPSQIKVQHDKKAQSTLFIVKLHPVLVMMHSCAVLAPVKTAIWGRTVRPSTVSCNAALQETAMQFMFLQCSFSKNRNAVFETATQFYKKLQRSF